MIPVIDKVIWIISFFCC